MKKIACFILALLIFSGSLTACTFTSNMSGVLAGEAECAPKVEEMLAALAEDRASEAQELMHPQAAEGTDAAIAQMSAYLAGSEVSTVELRNINISTSTGTAGQARQENVTCLVTLTDGNTICLSAVYLSNKVGAGFTSFRLILGVP